MSRTYSLGLVGEKNYQAAIGRCRTGEAVQVLQEIGNPHDDGALVVKSKRGETIGYVAREGWFRDAIDEGAGCTAFIKALNAGPREQYGVVLEVVLNGDGLESCRYGPAIAKARPVPHAGGAKKGLLARLLGL